MFYATLHLNINVMSCLKCSLTIITTIIWDLKEVFPLDWETLFEGKNHILVSFSGTINYSNLLTRFGMTNGIVA